MNKIIKMFTFAAGLLAMSACSESEYDIENLFPDKYNKILYIRDSGEQGVVLQNEEPTHTVEASIIKGGAVPTAVAKVNISVMDQQKVDDKWTNLTGRPHYLLPENCYSLSATSFDYTSEDMFKEFSVTFNTPEILDFINKKKAAKPDEAEYMKFVLPLQAVGATAADSINSQKNYVLYSIDNIAFAAPSSLYLVGDGVLETGGYIELSKSGNIFTGAGMFGSGEIYVCDDKNASESANFYTITKKGAIQLGKSIYSVPATGLNKIEVNFDTSKCISNNFGDNIDYFAVFFCPNNKVFDWKILYKGNGVFEGQGQLKFKQGSDERYKFHLVYKNGSKQVWGTWKNVDQRPEQIGKSEFTFDNDYYYMTQTAENQWDQKWKFDTKFHDKTVKITLYFNSKIPTHKIELVE